MKSLKSKLNETILRTLLALAVACALFIVACAPPELGDATADGGMSETADAAPGTPAEEIPAAVAPAVAAIHQALTVPTSEHACQVYSTEWATCHGFWGVPYPCRKTRIKSVWCYDNMLVETRAYGLYCSYYACAPDGVRRHWTGACAGLGSDHCYASPTKCFDSKLEKVGSCRYYVAPTIERCSGGSAACGAR